MKRTQILPNPGTALTLRLRTLALGGEYQRFMRLNMRLCLDVVDRPTCPPPPPREQPPTTTTDSIYQQYAKGDGRMEEVIFGTVSKLLVVLNLNMDGIC